MRAVLVLQGGFLFSLPNKTGLDAACPWLDCQVVVEYLRTLSEGWQPKCRYSSAGQARLPISVNHFSRLAARESFPLEVLISHLGPTR